MLKDATYKEKFSMLSDWMPSIVDIIKKDLKNDHLRNDVLFVRQYLPGKQANKLSAEELSQAYLQALNESERSEDIGEFISNRWLLKHTDLYHYFERELSKINPNFSELELIEAPVATRLVENALAEFTAPQTYIFCVLNSVVFPKEVFQQLEKRAKADIQKAAQEGAAREEVESKEALKRHCEQQIARLTDKYEKKLAGLQKKYTTDVDALKKQVATLQRKLNG